MSSVASKILLSLVVETAIVAWLGVRWLELSLGAGVALAWGVMLLVRTALTILSFALSEAYRGERSPSARIGIGGWVRLLCAEVWAVLRVFFVLHPFEPWLNRAEPQAVTNDMPTILVHGFFSNGGFWWGIKRYLHRHGIRNLYTVNLEPQFADIDELARQLEARVDQVCRATGHNTVILVGHSMGGLVCRAYIQHLEGARQTAKLVTIGTPHHGTVHACVLPGRNLRQMRPGSGWLDALNRGWTSIRLPTACAYSCHDEIVAPQDSGALAGTRNIPLAGIGHLEMAFSARIRGFLLREIELA